MKHSNKIQNTNHTRKSKLPLVLLALFSSTPLMISVARAEDPGTRYITRDQILTGITGTGADARWGGHRFNFGNYKQNTAGTDNPAVVWRGFTKSSDGLQLELLSQYVLYQTTFNDNTSDGNNYYTSKLKTSLGTFLNEAFTPAEQNLMLYTEVKTYGYKADSPYYNVNTVIGTSNDKVYVLSVPDMLTNGFPDTPDAAQEVKAIRQALATDWALHQGVYQANGGAHYWLRSPGSGDSNAAHVNDTGNVIVTGYGVSNADIGVRPASKINLQSLIFASTAEGGKSSAILGGGFVLPKKIAYTTEDPSPDGELFRTLEFTFQTSQIPTPKLGEFYVSGSRVAMAYRDAAFGADHNISVMTKLSGAAADRYDNYYQYAIVAEPTAKDSVKGADEQCEDGINILAGALDSNTRTLSIHGGLKAGSVHFASDPSTWIHFDVKVDASGETSKFSEFTLGEDYTDAKHKVAVGPDGVLKLLGLGKDKPYKQAITLKGNNSKLLTAGAATVLNGAITVSGNSRIEGGADMDNTTLTVSNGATLALDARNYGPSITLDGAGKIVADSSSTALTGSIFVTNTGDGLWSKIEGTQNFGGEGGKFTVGDGGRFEFNDNAAYSVPVILESGSRIKGFENTTFNTEIRVEGPSTVEGFFKPKKGVSLVLPNDLTADRAMLTLPDFDLDNDLSKDEDNRINIDLTGLSGQGIGIVKGTTFTLLGTLDGAKLSGGASENSLIINHKFFDEVAERLSNDTIVHAMKFQYDKTDTSLKLTNLFNIMTGHYVDTKGDITEIGNKLILDGSLGGSDAYTPVIAGAYSAAAPTLGSEKRDLKDHTLTIVAGEYRGKDLYAAYSEHGTTEGNTLEISGNAILKDSNLYGGNNGSGELHVSTNKVSAKSIHAFNRILFQPSAAPKVQDKDSLLDLENQVTYGGVIELNTTNLRHLGEDEFIDLIYSDGGIKLQAGHTFIIDGAPDDESPKYAQDIGDKVLVKQYGLGVSDQAITYGRGSIITTASYVSPKRVSYGNSKELKLDGDNYKTPYIAGAWHEDYSKVEGYTTTLSGSFRDRTIYAGYSNAEGAVSGNTVVLAGGDFTNSSIYGSNLPGGKNNTLVVAAKNLNAFGFFNFDNLNFVLPADIANGDTMFTVENKVGLENTAIEVDARAARLNVGDSLNLLVTDGFTSDKIGHYTTSELVDATCHIDIVGNVLRFTVDKMEENINSKAPVEGIAATVAGMQVAQDMATSAIANLDTSGRVGSIAGGSFGKYRLKSGSHSDVKGGGVVFGVTRRFSRAHAGVFAEIGKSNFDTYNENLKGKGDSNYYGAGVLAKTAIASSKFSLDGSLRAGRTKTNWSCEKGGYDDSAMYIGAHLGLSREAQFGAVKVRGYGQYLFNRVGKMRGLISGLDYQFKATSSHRSKLGLYSEFGRNSVKPYMDLAWEHEFDGKSNAKITNMNSSITAPSIKGNTGVAEVGVGFEKRGWYAKLGVSGAVGVRRGVSGQIAVGYKF